MHHAHKASQYVSYHQSHQHRERAQETTGQHLAHQAYQQSDAAHYPVLGRTEIGCSLSARKTIGSDGQQRYAYGCHHRCSHHRRDELHPILGAQTQHAFYQTAHYHRTHERTHTLCGGNGDCQAKEGETDAHHHRQARTDAPHGIELHQRAYASYHHTVLHQCSTQLRLQSGHIGQDDDGSHIAHKHGQHVLQTEGDSLPKGHPTVQRIKVTHGSKCEMLRCLYSCAIGHTSHTGSPLCTWHINFSSWGNITCAPEDGTGRSASHSPYRPVWLCSPDDSPPRAGCLHPSAVPSLWRCQFR